MRQASIVEQATATGRRAIALSLLGVALVAGALFAERIAFQAGQAQSRQELLDANASVGMLIYADLQQTAALNLAIATGEQQWLDMYAQTFPVIEQGLDAALSFAPPADAAAIREDGDRAGATLRRIEGEAIAVAARGGLEEARQLLQTDEYLGAKATIAEVGARVMTAVVGTVEADVARRNAQSTWTLAGILLLGVVFGAVYWSRLARGLSRTETALSSAEDVIRELAQTDALTGLANRRALMEVLAEALPRVPSALSVLMIDLDHFKPVNDRFGHVAGDLALKEAAQRLKSTLRKGEFAARIGGDEFVVLVEHLRGGERPRKLAEQIVKRLSEPFSVDGATVRLGATVGVAAYPEQAADAHEILRMADVALYRAKEAGRGRAVGYEPHMDEEMEARAQAEDELREALASGQVTPYFQPIVDLETGGVVGFEALSRWKHPERGFIPPSEFIPAAERSGLIGDLTFTLMRRACIAARALPAPMRLAINISPRQIEDPWLAEKLLGVLTETGFPARQLEIEVTETALINDLAAAKRVISSLKNLGVSIALDDFGTGYSSLCYLSELPFDKIKIDRAFVSSMTTRPESVKVVAAIVGLGRSLQVPTVAEGVETEREAELLWSLGCSCAQGWLYQPALPPEEAMALVAEDAVPERRAGAA